MDKEELGAIPSISVSATTSTILKFFFLSL
jgi:hypothetical protein